VLSGLSLALAARLAAVILLAKILLFELKLSNWSFVSLLDMCCLLFG